MGQSTAQVRCGTTPKIFDGSRTRTHHRERFESIQGQRAAMDRPLATPIHQTSCRADGAMI
jgi:hypothetical protein